MSHSTGAVLRTNGEILLLEYNGTIDVCRSNLFKTREELDANWRTNKWTTCRCKPIIREPVKLCVTYGGGWMWDAFICPTCMCITDRFTPHDMSDNEEYSAVEGIADWYPNRELYE